MKNYKLQVVQIHKILLFTRFKLQILYFSKKKVTKGGIILITHATIQK